MTICTAAIAVLAAPATSSAAPGTAWTQLGADVDGTGLRDLSGSSVAVSSDGNTIAIGAPTDGFRIYSGYVRVMRYDGASWNQLGDDIVGGVGDSFGWSVALSSDGNTVAVGAIYNGGPGSDGAGYVRVHRFDGASWGQLGDDIDGEAPSDRAGWAVALSADGESVAVGAPHNAEAGSFAGHVRVFRLADTTWTQVGADIDGAAAGDEFGASVALSSDGGTIAIGSKWSNAGTADRVGQVRVLRLVDGAWIPLGGAINGGEADENFGYSVALSDDGATVAVGAPFNDDAGVNAGQVRVLGLVEGGWVQAGAEIDGEAAGDNFGWSVALSGDGVAVAVGGPDNDDGTGAHAGHVRVMRSVDGAWEQSGADIEGEAADDFFGGAVALSSAGNRVAVGAPSNDSDELDAGHVRVFASIVVADVSITGTTHTYDGSPREVTVVTDPAGIAHVVTYGGSSTPPTDAGSYDVEVTITEPGHVSDPDPVTATMTIAKASQSIDFAALDDKTFGDGPFDLAAVATSGLAVEFSVAGACTSTGSTVTITAAGECTATATQSGDDNHAAAAPVEHTFPIARADAVVDITDTSHTYDGAAHGAEISTVPADLDVTVTYDGSATPPTDAGSYEISVVVEDPNYDPTPVLGTLTIEKADQTIVIDAPSSTPVDGEPFDVVASSSSGLSVDLIATGSCSIAAGTVTPTGVGDCLITATQAGDGNHLAAEPVIATISITTATLSLTGLPEQIQPGDSVTVSLTGFESGEIVDLVLRSDPVKVAEVLTDARGAAGVAFTAPDDLAAGRHTLTATGRTSALSVVEPVTVIVPVTPTTVEAITQPTAESFGTLPTTGVASWLTSVLGVLLVAVGLALVVVAQVTAGRDPELLSSASRTSR